MTSIQINRVGFRYDTMHEPLFDNLTLHLSQGFTGVVGPNGAGKSTLLRLLAGTASPTNGVITTFAQRTAFCLQETDKQPETRGLLCDSCERLAIDLKSRFALFGLELVEWDGLSHGERKRFQLACALLCEPEVLLLDEPTNHLDPHNRTIIIQALRHFRGIAVVVSHDREVLENLCDFFVFIEKGRVHTEHGRFQDVMDNMRNWARFVEQRQDLLAQEAGRLKVESNRLEQVARSSRKALSKKGLAKGDSDTRERINRVRLTGKDRSGTQKKVLLDKRIERIDSERGELGGFRSYGGSISWKGEGRPCKPLWFPAATITIPDGRQVAFRDTSLGVDDKIGVIGDNGSGKTTLIRYLWETHLRQLDARVHYLPQEFTDTDRTCLVTLVRNLSNDQQGRLLQLIARMGSEPTHLLQSDNWSPGLLRKAAIGYAMFSGANLLVLDEPTNHLDLPSLVNLENLLQEAPLQLIIVSHDHGLIRQVCNRVWRVQTIQSNDNQWEVKEDLDFFATS